MISGGIMLNLQFCANGLISRGLDLPSNFEPPLRKGKVSKRSRVRGFSPASCRRLRESLCRWVGDGLPYAFTFTFPYDLTGVEYRRLFERFRHKMIYSQYSMIWRVELTRHKRPHLHCVVYLKSVEDAFKVQRMWWSVVNAYAFEGGCFYSCVFQSLTGAAWLRYLSAHTAKQKFSQLGWRGRQWGFVNRGLMHDTLRDVSPGRKGFFRVLRVLRRLSRSRSSNRGFIGQSVWFCSLDTAFRLASWAARE